MEALLHPDQIDRMFFDTLFDNKRQAGLRLLFESSSSAHVVVEFTMNNTMKTYSIFEVVELHEISGIPFHAPTPD